MSTKDERLYLIHILECIERVRRYTGNDWTTFLTSALVQDAVLRNLQTMAESTQRLSGAMKATHPEVNWQRLAGFRNVLTHGYLDIDMERVVEIMDGFLMPLEQAVAAMLAEANEDEPPP